MNTKMSLLKACTLYSFYSPGDVSDMSLEVVLFMFIRSLREANFEMFLTFVIKTIVPWMFALNYVHYARWLPVYL